MGTVSDFRTGLADTLSQNLDGVNVYRLPEDRIDVPAVMVAGISVQPDTMGNTGGTLLADVYVLVSRRHADQIDELDALVDPTEPSSVPAVIIDNPTLGDTVASAVFVSVDQYREVDNGGTGYYGATVTVEALL